MASILHLIRVLKPLVVVAAVLEIVALLATTPEQVAALVAAVLVLLLTIRMAETEHPVKELSVAAVLAVMAARKLRVAEAAWVRPAPVVALAVLMVALAVLGQLHLLRGRLLLIVAGVAAVAFLEKVLEALVLAVRADGLPHPLQMALLIEVPVAAAVGVLVPIETVEMEVLEL
jgi:uncharacterized membrane protein